MRLGQIDARKIQSAAKKICHSILGHIPGQVDHQGNDIEDYKGMLVERGLVAFQKFDSNKMATGPEDVYRYAYRAMWNHARNYARSKSWLSERVVPYGDYLQEEMGNAFEDRLEARNVLRKMEAELPEKEMGILVDLGLHDGCIDHAYDASTKVGIAGHRKRIRALRVRVKEKYSQKEVAFSRSQVLSTDERADMVTRRHIELVAEIDYRGLPRMPDSTDEELEEILAKGWSKPMEKPECFGQIWDTTGDSPCKGCALASGCFDLFARQTLPQVQKEMGGSKNPDEIGLNMGVSGEAVGMALSYLASGATVIPAVEPPTSPGQTAEAITPASAVAPAIPEKAVEEPKSAEMPKKKGKNRPQKPGSVTPAKDPGAVKAKTAHTAKEQAAIKQPRRKKEQLSKRRMKARAGRSQARLQKELATKPRKAPGKKQVGSGPFGQRCAREKKNKWVRMLTPGMALQKTWRGKLYEVKVLPVGYQWKGQAYPTLYSVVMAITGEREYAKQTRKGGRPTGKRIMSAWSAPRFFNLQKLLSRV